MKWFDIARSRMEILKITQDTLAEHVGVTKGAISHWLNGRRDPGLEKVAEIFQYLGVSDAILNNDGTFSLPEDADECTEQKKCRIFSKQHEILLEMFDSLPQKDQENFLKAISDRKDEVDQIVKERLEKMSKKAC
ncbi:helix-turn-helix domain-containing protein [Photorhabdus kleinii]|uniref:helix-turn-helix domain-containing protein n=1 Tax=Photorhabdus kleinii TaxID=768034 RepID=UPI0021D49708|nr:helix-turn-helix domain-containing protein [Photorhabdus kleinii]MCT8345139.1 helix-turn-helix domain-containing protein [Photorhabdus kleinii]